MRLKCPECGGMDISVARDGHATRYCNNCLLKWTQDKPVESKMDDLRCSECKEPSGVLRGRICFACFQKEVKERYLEWLVSLPRGTTVRSYTAWVAAFEREVAPLRKRLAEAEAALETYADPFYWERVKGAIKSKNRDEFSFGGFARHYFDTHKPLEGE